MDALFPEARSNGWSVGECHVLAPKLILPERVKMSRMSVVSMASPHLCGEAAKPISVKAACSTVR